MGGVDMEQIEVASLEDLRGLIESMPENVVITVPLGKGEDMDGQTECI